MIASSASRYFDIIRRTGFALAATTVLASMSLDYQPRVSTYLQVELTGGTTGSGTVTFTGTDAAGAPQSETLTFSSNGIQVTTKSFLTAAITTTGLHDEPTPATIAVRAVSADGTENLIEVTIKTQRPAIYSPLFGARGTNTFQAMTDGTHETGRGTIFFTYEETWTPRVGDLVKDPVTDEIWLTRSVDETRVGFGIRPDHWRIGVTRYDS